MSSPRLWIALTRPDNLVNALAVAAATRGAFAGCRLVHEESRWWQPLDWREWQVPFDAVHPVRKVPTCRGLRDLPRFHRALRERQRALSALPVAPGDTLVLLAGITALSNALVSAHPAARTILCVPLKKYAEANESYSFRRHRHTTSGWLQHRWLEPRLGLHRTLHLKPWRGGGDGVRIKRLAAPPEAVFDEIVVLSNDGRERPPGAGPRVHPAPFPTPRDLPDLLPATADAPPGRKKVVFFGTPFRLVRNLDPAVYAARLNACLDFLRTHYAPACALVYRPHPAETREREALRLDGFTVETDGEVAEVYFLRRFREIEAVFSVSSTVSRVALNFGLNGHALWRCFPFDGTAAAYFEGVLGRVPPEFDVRSLDAPPRPYAHRTNPAGGTPRFAETLAALCAGDKPRRPGHLRRGKGA